MRLALLLTLVGGAAVAQEDDRDDEAAAGADAEAQDGPALRLATPRALPASDEEWPPGPPLPVLLARPYDHELFTPEERRSPRFVRLTVGAAARSLFRVGFGGVAVGLAAGSDGPEGAWSFTVDGMVGASAERLLTAHVELGFLGEAKMDRLRIGAGARTGVFLIRRATDGRPITLCTFGPRFTASYDVARTAHAALLVGIDLGLNFAFFASTAMFNGTLYLGVRL